MPHYSYSEARGTGGAAGGVFDDVAGRCVLLAMPGRLERAEAQLRADRPHSAVTVQLNPGRAGKGLVEDTTRADICHALAAAFRHSLARGGGRLLVLEDDFFLGGEAGVAAARAAAGRVAAFLRGREFDTYNLGRSLFVGWPCSMGSWRALAHTSAHAVVYSERFMARYLAQHDEDPRPIVRVGNDFWWNRADMVHYVYRTPLAYQTFPATGNRAMWDSAPTAAAIRLLGLDRSHEPGYRVLNWACKALLPAAAAALAALAWLAWLAARRALRAA